MLYKGAKNETKAVMEFYSLINFSLPSTKIAFFLSFPNKTIIVSKKAAIKNGKYNKVMS